MSFRLDNIGLTYANGYVALAGVNLGVARGERLAVIGASGAGKTTLLRLLGTAARPSRGGIEVLDAEPWALRAGALRALRARIGMIHQAPPLPPRQRVVTAVLAGRLGAWPWWKSLASLFYPLDAAGAEAVLRRLDLGERLWDRCDRLSGGQLQRVGIARALYQCPQLMLADEPVSAMDPSLAAHTVRVLNDEAERLGATLAASLHAVDLALLHFPRIVGVKAGRIAFDLPARAVTDAMLRDLYATERGELPTFAADSRHGEGVVSLAGAMTKRSLCG